MYGLQKILDKTPKKQQQHQTKNHHQKKTPNKQKTKPKESTFLKRYYCDLWCRRVILYKGYLNNAWITEKKTTVIFIITRIVFLLRILNSI